MTLPPLTLVIGGAASGKSAWAEGLVASSGLAKVYIATAEARDAEMRVKIEAHRQARAGQGWRTVEVPIVLPAALAELEAEEVGLIDCATFWLSNQISEGLEWEPALETLLDAFDMTAGPVVVVTNELGHGVVPAHAATRAFREAHGHMNQALAEAADLVVFVTAGLPMVLKGALA
ncbi:bifunctional adenosylcobinamide kinase/adenosylcobinamide-phosphate guanylyltransferase [Rhodobacterales bacterium HKCCE3408]|nr:bifunctional adenosylcobinamide kinase/adenosylcobinamide-phosphate guanylyltransferase [Rhodobacterales bacterium HKCCE3408]